MLFIAIAVIGNCVFSDSLWRSGSNRPMDCLGFELSGVPTERKSIYIRIETWPGEVRTPSKNIAIRQGHFAGAATDPNVYRLARDFMVFSLKCFIKNVLTITFMVLVIITTADILQIQTHTTVHTVLKDYTLWEEHATG